MSYKDPIKQREYQRDRRNAARAAFFAGAFCSLCGSINKLELDHIDRRTKTGHNIWSWTIKRRLAEIDKCQILCQKCHIKKTLRERGFIAGVYKHGNRWTKGCRCNLCREWHRGREKQRLERKRLELLSPACRAGVLPLNYRPSISQEYSI